MMTRENPATGIGNLIALALAVLLSLLMLPDQALGQGRRRGSGDSVALPEKRTPVTATEMNLSSIPFQIAFESYRETDGRSNWEICLINADGSGLVNLTSTPEVNEFYPHASPDGRRLCFVADEGEGRYNRSRNAYIMNIDGSGRTRIAENARQPCWSPDGKKIAYLKGEYSRYNANSWANRGLEIYDLETGEVTRHPDEDIGHVYNLCWSPDGEWFIATSRDRSGGNSAYRVDSRTEMSLSIRGCRPDISPDGRLVAWGRTDQDLDIGAIDFGTRRNNVTDQRAVVACERDHKVYHVDWSPDGNYLAFSYGSARGSQGVGSRAPGWDICICDLRTGQWTRITIDSNDNKEPDWIPAHAPRSR
ncbi:TolB family protein [Gemmatimonadota bacterium]